MEKVKGGQAASRIALIGGVFSLVCAAVLVYMMIDPVSEFSPWAVPQLLFGFFALFAVPFLAVYALRFTVKRLRQCASPSKDRTGALIGAICAGTAVLIYIGIYLRLFRGVLFDP